MLEVFVNRKDSSDYKIQNTVNLHSNDGYNYYGKYIDVDSQNGLNQIYISSYQLDTTPTVHPIETLQVCNHLQTYSSGSDSCSSV
eukprot:CAMPEP_0168354294 /NCGR_PEP_ID=MMETSP0213-20121227/23812_1 /TAXON_ID=151035 /ORGANISM="Euplotes harpa, Strain FSP1.4" /LENGTH=84 /DNA_ID=CAMNT_0008366171 /DNA_START=665 /DNA_END=916 /DNA_ORIENTATION=-